MFKVIHVIPFDGIGGVEVAANTMSGDDSFQFELVRIFSNVNNQSASSLKELNPLPYIKAARAILKKKPDLVIVSLWKSVLVGLWVKLFAPRVKLVTFLHNSVDSHFVDYFLTRVSIGMSAAIFADSRSTAEFRSETIASKPLEIISFVTKRLDAAAAVNVRPHFIFWGRISKQKNLTLALEIFSQIYKFDKSATYTIIGPDGGQRAKLEELCQRLGIADAVNFTGPLDIRGIQEYAARASFYLQTSLYEGMAMSVVEAMQLGLVPIVTGVGEIANYCTNEKNAVLIEDMEASTLAVNSLMTDDARYQQIRINAVETWGKAKLYKESLAKACNKLLAVTVAE